MEEKIKGIDTRNEVKKTYDMRNTTKYVVIAGCTLSGIGKGTTMSSIGITLKSCGLKVTCIKIDPYLNTDAGLMSPFEHGEVFVLDDGGEVDLDLGNYERALNITLTRRHNITSGKIFSSVLEKERQGFYLGKTVQMIPHVTDEIMREILKVSHLPVENGKFEGKYNHDPKLAPNICLIEIGGTVGDLESGIFFEAIRTLLNNINRQNLFFILLTYVPEIGEDKEQKTKPSQHGFKELKTLGLNPDFIICRSEGPLTIHNLRKIGMFCNLNDENVCSAYNCKSIHEVPLVLAAQDIHKKILHHFGISDFKFKFSKWIQLAHRYNTVKQSGPIVNIAVCGKYTHFRDSYLSLIKALNDAALYLRLNLNVIWVESTDLELTNNETSNPSEKKESEEKSKFDQAWANLKKADGILIPGGFGSRGVEGKISVCNYARENKIPYFGICLGFQIAVIELARNILGFKDANSEEFDMDTIHNVVIEMLEHCEGDMGGTARLGSKTTRVKDEKSLAYKIYKSNSINERHRHRYEVNPRYINILEEKAGVKFSGKGDGEDENRMEILELPGHPFYFGVQFHPEFKTNYFDPSPPFLHFVAAAAKVEIEAEVYKDFDEDEHYKDFLSYYKKYSKNFGEKLSAVEQVFENYNVPKDEGMYPKGWKK